MIKTPLFITVVIVIIEAVKVLATASLLANLSTPETCAPPPTAAEYGTNAALANRFQ